MDNSLFVFSPLYLWAGFAILALIVKEMLRARGTISPARHRHHHQHHDEQPVAAHHVDRRRHDHHHHDHHHPHAA